MSTDELVWEELCRNKDASVVSSFIARPMPDEPEPDTFSDCTTDSEMPELFPKPDKSARKRASDSKQDDNVETLCMLTSLVHFALHCSTFSTQHGKCEVGSLKSTIGMEVDIEEAERIIDAKERSTNNREDGDKVQFQAFDA